MPPWPKQQKNEGQQQNQQPKHQEQPLQQHRVEKSALWINADVTWAGGGTDGIAGHCDTGCAGW
jgi:hypothetical protein